MNHSALSSFVAACLTTGLGLAQGVPGFGGLAGGQGGARNQVPGVDFPMLELDSRFGILTSRARLVLHEGGRSRPLGVLDQTVLMASHDAYRFRNDGEDTPERARVNFLDFSADVGVKIALEHPRQSLTRRGAEVGRIRQRALFSVGTGIDVYEKGSFEDSIGYVDQKVASTFGRDLLLGFATFGLHTPDKVYTFYKVERRTVPYQGRNPFRRTEVETTRTPLFHFTTGQAAGAGPGGVFMKPDGTPVLAIQGDWWVSQNIFDLLVKRKDAEGTAGKVLRGLGTVVELLDDDPSNDGDSLADGQEFVRNPSAYLGSFLIGIVYFQEFRDLVGVQLPLAPVR